MNTSPKVHLQAASGASAEIHLHGAHLTSWKTPDDREQLFVSSTSEYGPGAAIRGGVPVVFPQFSGLGPLKKHGFARNLSWAVIQSSPEAVTLRLSDDNETYALWPHAFVLELTVRLNGWSLEMTLRVQNMGEVPFDFTTALHGYFAVENILQTHVTGLRGLLYRNNPTQTEHEELADSITFGTEIDRAYFGASGREVTIQDGPRHLHVTQRGFVDTVVWNPSAAVAAKIPDLEPEGWQRYVCVEAATVKPSITLAAGQCWTGTQRIDAHA